MEKLTGLCLTFCIRDIIQGKVAIDEVVVIISPTTSCKSINEWKPYLEAYKEFWNDDPKKGVRIFMRLIRAGKVIQPKLLKKEAPRVAYNNWWRNQFGTAIYRPEKIKPKKKKVVKNTKKK